MINYYLTICFLTIGLQSLACTFFPDDFCRTIEEFPDDIVVYGTISSRNENSIDVAVIDVLRGEETREEITIWDGTDFDCNGFFSMSTETIGWFNDTILIMLPRILEIENEWEIIGDYRRPDPYAYRPELVIQNGNVKGSIIEWGYDFQEIPYQEMKEKFLDTGNCDLILSGGPNINYNIEVEVINPFKDNLLISFSQIINNGNIALFSSNGSLVYDRVLNNSSRFNLEANMFNPGLYILEIRTENKPFKRMKLFKI